MLFDFLYRHGEILPQPTPAISVLASGTLPVVWFFISGFVITWTTKETLKNPISTRSRSSL